MQITQYASKAIKLSVQIACCAITLSIALPTAAQDTKPDSRPSSNSSQLDPDKLVIKKIEVGGNRLIPTAEILQHVTITTGEMYNREKLLNDLRAINAMGFFDDRALRLDPSLDGENGVDIVFRVNENQTVTEVQCKGNEIIESDVILNRLSTLKGRPENWYQLDSITDDVEKMYQQQGYPLARAALGDHHRDGIIELVLNEGLIDVVKVLSAPNRLTSSSRGDHPKLRIQISSPDGTPILVDTRDGLSRSSSDDALSLSDVNKERKSEALTFILKETAELKGKAYSEQRIKKLFEKLCLFDGIAKIEHFVSPSAANPDQYTLTLVVTEQPPTLPIYISPHKANI